MVDLGSALAIVGLSIQVLNTLVESLSAGHERIYQARECGDRLRSFSFRLQDGLAQLEEWLMKWKRDGTYHDTFYRNLWGEEGWQSIEQRLHRIEQLSHNIQRVLCRYPKAEDSSGLSDRDLRNWRRAHRSRIFQSPCTRRAADPKVGLWQRVGFSLFDNARLKDYVDDFVVEVRELDQFSRRKLRLRQGRDDSVPVTFEEIQELAQLILLLESAFDFGNVTWDSLVDQKWSLYVAALELNPPAQTFDQWREWDLLYHEYFVRSQASANRYRVRVEVEWQVPDIKHSLQELVGKIETLIGHRSNDLPSQCRASLLGAPGTKSIFFRDMVLDDVFSCHGHQSFNVDRADLALGLTHWMIISWNTPWTESMCTCRIRCMRSEAESLTRHVYEPSHHFRVPTTQCRCELQRSDRDVYQYKLIILGIALAEIALGVSVRACCDDPNTLRVLVNDKQTSVAELVASLRRRLGQKTVAHAVSFCLNIENAMAHDVLWVHQLPAILKHVLHPVMQYHKTIMEFCNDTPPSLVHDPGYVDRYYREHGTG